MKIWNGQERRLPTEYTGQMVKARGHGPQSYRVRFQQYILDTSFGRKTVFKRMQGSGHDFSVFDAVFCFLRDNVLCLIT